MRKACCCAKTRTKGHLRVKVQLLQSKPTKCTKKKKNVNLVEMQCRRNIKIAFQETGDEYMKWTGCFRPG
jgi:hypothetical protein